MKAPHCTTLFTMLFVEASKYRWPKYRPPCAKEFFKTRSDLTSEILGFKKHYFLRLSGIKQKHEGNQLKKSYIYIIYIQPLQHQVFMYINVYIYISLNCTFFWLFGFVELVVRLGGKHRFDWNHGAVENGIIPCCTGTLLGDTGWYIYPHLSK